MNETIKFKCCKIPPDIVIKMKYFNSGSGCLSFQSGAIEAVAAGLTWVPWSDIGSYIGGAVRDKVSDKALEAIWEAGQNALNGDASSHPLDKEIQALCDA